MHRVTSEGVCGSQLLLRVEDSVMLRGEDQRKYSADQARVRRGQRKPELIADWQP